MSPTAAAKAISGLTVTRFAPSPTGYLHLGHVRSAFAGWRAARRDGGRFLLRIEDIDRTRCQEQFAAAILEDLAWLGLDWDGPVRRQSEHFDDYRAALDHLAAMRVLYPCFCTRREIQAEIARAGGAPHGTAGPPYPGTCRRLGAAEVAARQRSGQDFALRLSVGHAYALTGPLHWFEGEDPQRADPSLLGDVVLARKEMPASYHLAVTVDDAIQGVTLVTRGDDLRTVTHVHRLLQALLDLPTPRYRHHPLLTDDTGRRLSKRDGARTIRAIRQEGMNPADVIALAEAAPRLTCGAKAGTQSTRGG
ncbi:MAG: tRNA glutamyl-Q(34) synthetase GluQRS [Stellaceae bacterium]